MRSIVFEGDTWSRYEELRKNDHRIHRTLCRILKEMQRGDPGTGTGKPEPLKHSLRGFWSRRLSHGDRLVYRYDNDRIYIFGIGGHYS